MDLPTIVDVLRLNPEKLPQWLPTDGPVRFERQTFFASRTVFYPGSGGDRQPVKLCALSRAVHSFVYVDQGVDQHAIPERPYDAELGCQGYPLATSATCLPFPSCRCRSRGGARSRSMSGGSKRDQRVPLSARALKILHEARELSRGTGLVFPSVHVRALGDNTIPRFLRNLRIEAGPHRFRSSFRDRAARCSDAPREVCELALEHVNSDRAEAVYRRTDLFERRRVLMEDWSAFVGRSAEGGEQHVRC